MKWFSSLCCGGGARRTGGAPAGDLRRRTPGGQLRADLVRMVLLHESGGRGPMDTISRLGQVFAAAHATHRRPSRGCRGSGREQELGQASSGGKRLAVVLARWRPRSAG